MPSKQASVVVIAPVYVDIAVRCEQFPPPGGTVKGSGFSYRPTGPGINQATQIALCDCGVSLIAKVGTDIFGDIIRQNLNEHNISQFYIHLAEARNTGIIVTIVNQQGQNISCISDGSNSALRPEEIQSAHIESLIAQADACLIHGRLPQDVIVAAIKTCKLQRTPVLLDPALDSGISSGSLAELPFDYYSVDVLMPDIHEAAELVQEKASLHTAKLIGSDLVARGAGCAVIKLGRQGCMVVDRDKAEHVPAFDVGFVDHSGCSDAFAGALAASIAAGDEIIRAVRFAGAAGAIACSRFGEQDALPKKAEIIELLQTRGD